jgi:serine/threonine protein kinase
MKAVSKCKVYKKNLKNKTAKEIEEETSLLLITDGGDDLVKWVEKTTTSSRTNIINFWKEAIRLFRGLKAFKTHSLMHHDLKPQNVVYDMEMKRLNFIDFGLMRSIKTEALKCSAAKGCVANSHWNYPTDIILMGKSIYNLAVKNRGAFYDEYYKMIGKDNPFGNAYSIFIQHIFDTKNDARKKAFEIRFWQGFKELINKLPANGYAKFLDISLKGFDVFGLGLTLMYVLSRTKKVLDPKSVALMDDLFFRMMTPDVYSRLSIEEATKEYEKVLVSLS